MKEEIDMAYAAGILDGDGSFSIMKAHGKYYPCIQLSNAYKGMSEWLYEKFGGSLRIKKPQQTHHKPLYVWSVRGLGGCYSAIEKFQDFLILKRSQADTMRHFISRRQYPDFTEKDGEEFSKDIKYYNRKLLIEKDSLCKQVIKDNDNPNFWAYFGGLMDTEGSFSIKKEKPHSGSVGNRYNPVIQLTMVPAMCINYIRRNFSLGSFCIPAAKCTTKGYAYKMSILSKDECITFIDKILPYLRFKKGQASIILNFCKNYGSVKHCRAGIPTETLEFRENMYQQVRKLNA